MTSDSVSYRADWNRSSGILEAEFELSRISTTACLTVRIPAHEEYDLLEEFLSAHMAVRRSLLPRQKMDGSR